LVHAQKREAIWTEGYAAWKTKYRRFVRKGEKGIMIFAPVPVKPNRNNHTVKPEERLEPIDPEKQEKEEFVLFRPVYVWDYSQTSGCPVAKIESMLEKRNDAKKAAYATAGENLGMLSGSMVDLIAQKGLEVVYKDLGPAGGMAGETTIYIDKALGIGADLGTLIHEYSHIMLGHTEKGGNESDIELEAELTVGLVKGGLRLDIQSQAAYLFSWSLHVNDKQREVKFLNAFKKSQPLANEILNHLIEAAAETKEGDMENDIAA
jgi:hypothetical protein